MSALTIEEIKDKLRNGCYSYRAVSESTGVSYNVVRNLAKGEYETCEYESGRKLAEFLSK